jgi:F-type H+-transporting ATPase subunit gamma
MASLKDLKNRIGSVKNTRKITSAMKMVAAAKLRKAQEQAEAGRPFAERMDAVLGSLAASAASNPGAPKLLAGTGSDQRHLIVLATADRGLCGGFNANLIKEAMTLRSELLAAGKSVQFVTVGRKARDAVRRVDAKALVEAFTEMDRPTLSYDKAQGVAAKVMELFQADAYDVCTLVYSRFQSAIAQIPTRQQLVPFAVPEGKGEAASGSSAVYEYEPSEAAVLADLLPRNISVQIFKGLLENQASEQGARMSAMDNATRNAGDMIGKLTLLYNRTRQAQITKELIEIVSGAEAL